MSGLFLSAECWEIIQIDNFPVFDLEAIVRQAVGEGKVPGSKREIVAGNLGEGTLRNFHIGRLALYQQMWVTVGTQYHDIRSLGQFVIKKARFDGKERFGVLVVANEQMHEMLPDPFFGRKHDVFPADQIVNVRFPVQVFNFVRKGRQI